MGIIPKRVQGLKKLGKQMNYGPEGSFWKLFPKGSRGKTYELQTRRKLLDIIPKRIAGLKKLGKQMNY